MSHLRRVMVFVCGLMAIAAAPAAAQLAPANETAVLAALDTMIQATVRKDFATLERIYHDDLMYSHTVDTIPTQTKAQVLADLKTPRIFESITFTTPPVVKIYGQVALVRVNVLQRNGSPGAINDNHLHILWVLVNGPQGWQVAVRHPTRRMAPPPPAQ